MDSRWHEAVVRSCEPAAEGLFRLVLDVQGTAASGSHVRPGQFIRVALPDCGEGCFALASTAGPSGAQFELLVKEGGALTDALTRLVPGDRLQVSAPEGPGFPIDRARGRRVLLFATGSGISPIRSVIAEILRAPEAFREVTLFFGVRTPASFAYAHEFTRWRQAGVKVVLTVSRPGASGWSGLRGYVQNHVGELVVEDAVAFVCGQREMVTQVTQALVARGMHPGDVYENY